MRKTIAAVTGLGVLLLALAASADTLILRDGTRISGRLVGVAARIVTFEDASGVTHRHPADEVAALEFAPGRGRNASTEALDGARALEEHGSRGDKTLVQSMTDSLRLYAIVAAGRK